jgi:hypothetical protein
MRLTTFVGLGLLALTTTAPAFADGCPTLDLACVAEGTTDEVGGTVDEIVDPVGEATEPVVEHILEEVDAILGGGGSVDPPGGGGDGGSRPGVGPTGGGITSGSGQVRDPLLAPTSSGITPRQVSDVTVGPVVFIGPREDDLLGSGPSGGIGRVLAGAARSTIVVLVLLGVALAFVVIQNRLDRNDPKLALAQVRPDVLRFE